MNRLTFWLASVVQIGVITVLFVNGDCEFVYGSLLCLSLIGFFVSHIGRKCAQKVEPNNQPIAQRTDLIVRSASESSQADNMDVGQESACDDTCNVELSVAALENNANKSMEDDEHADHMREIVQDMVAKLREGGYVSRNGNKKDFKTLLENVRIPGTQEMKGISKKIEAWRKYLVEVGIRIEGTGQHAKLWLSKK